jgi:dTMP kinase
MDFLPNRDYYEAYVEYQTRLLAQFEAMIEEYDFHRVDATRSIREVFQDLTAQIEALLADMKPVPLEQAKHELAEEKAETAAGK